MAALRTSTTAWPRWKWPWPSPSPLMLAALAALGLCSSGATGSEAAHASEGEFAALVRMDSRRVMMRVRSGSPLPAMDDEIMLDVLDQWKWRVEMAAAGAAILSTSSNCPHGLGLLPLAFGWQGGGHWRKWPGTFEYRKGRFGKAASVSSAASWSVIHAKKACEGSPGVRKLESEVRINVQSVEDCQKSCERTKGCEAIDFYYGTKWCNLFDRPCSDPFKTHDGASSWKLVRRFVESQKGDALETQELSFLGAKQRCHEIPGCIGFSFNGTWSDQDRLAGNVKAVYFYRRSKVSDVKGEKWHSYQLIDTPRAHCNPEGPQFECPRNPYACLGLSIDADDVAIKQAYRALSKEKHPDKVRSSHRTAEAVHEAEEAFRDLANAHDVLRDPKQRRQADKELKRGRKQWEEEMESVQDLYIKEALVTSVAPESYAALIHQGQEWLVHFFLPTNGDCKQMKIALARAASDLGTGDEERDIPRPEPKSRTRFFAEGDVFRGVLRERASQLLHEGATAQDGDTHIALVLSDQTLSSAKLLVAGDEFEVEIASVKKQEKGKKEFTITTPDRVFTGRFDKDNMWFRGTVAERSQLDSPVASFALRLDQWEPQPMPDSGRTPRPGSRSKPRLYGAVNCGRHPDFCKRKGADPAKERLFPQVRVLFPDEVRFEVYRGRPLARDVVAFAREAMRPRGEVQKFTANDFHELQSRPRSTWLVLFHRETSVKATWDCELCKTALPMLRRTAPRLAESSLRAAWINCTMESDACGELLESDGNAEQAPTADWGAIRLVEFTGDASRSATVRPLWDAGLLRGEITQQGLLASMEAVSRAASMLWPRVATPEHTAHPDAKVEL